ncbi:Bax inhibitor 1 isoform X2 [Thraustotheca clavata]|uniref:Bax inhibitor 1 isoform X2 n=1 Tax=Thraustotheca clavata TaxID=74557 RepID=A0A1V9ZZV9_9STRA|nr:Bax inhibitor 1 isoform X2 [Thraustotheca clavata]
MYYTVVILQFDSLCARDMEAFSQNFDFAALFKANDISVPVQQHLVRVYATLAGTVLSAGLGASLDFMFDLAGVLTTCAMVGMIFWLSFIDTQYVTKRLSILMGVALCSGINIGPLLEVAVDMDPSIVITAFLATTVIFLCFTASALIEKRRTYLYMISFISSATMVMSFISIIYYFSRSSALYNAHMYLGLFVFCAYVLFDTQMIIERASLGDRDFILHALTLFLDFVNLFVRLISIIMRNQQQKDKKRTSRR